MLVDLYSLLVPRAPLPMSVWMTSGEAAAQRRQAVDEFLEKTGERRLLVRMSSGRIAVKP